MAETTKKKRTTWHAAKGGGKKSCTVKDCKRPYRAKGYCTVHYQAWRRGEMEGHKSRYKICTKEGCRKPRAVGSLCAEHAAKEKEGGA